MGGKFAKIAVSEVTYWVDKPYDYRIPAEMADKIKPGMRVYVPFSRGNRRAEGIVLSICDSCDYPSVKSIISLLDEGEIFLHGLRSGQSYSARRLVVFRRR